MRTIRIAAVVVVIAALAVAQRLGVFQQLAEPARVAQKLVELGPWGYAAFVVAYAVLQPFGVPGTVFIMAAPLIWPWPVAFALSMTGTMAASVVGFSFARFVGRDWISTRIPARFQRYDDALSRRAFTTVFLLRLVFWRQAARSYAAVASPQGTPRPTYPHAGATAGTAGAPAN
ncbi:MAG: TVP38/TMEM64 family protein [Byssovorax sp.]